MRNRRMTASMRLTAAVGLRAPERFRIWHAGPNPWDGGTVWFTPAAAASVMGEFLRRGNALVMDIEHALNPAANPQLDPSDPPMTAGVLVVAPARLQSPPAGRRHPVQLHGLGLLVLIVVDGLVLDRLLVTLDEGVIDVLHVFFVFDSLAEEG